MAAHPKPATAQQTSPMLSSGVKVHSRDCRRSTRIQASRIENTSVTEKEPAYNKKTIRQQVVEGELVPRRYACPRTKKSVLPTTSSALTRKRSRGVEIEQNPDLRRSKRQKATTGQKLNWTTAGPSSAPSHEKRQRRAQGDSRKRTTEDKTNPIAFESRFAGDKKQEEQAVIEGISPRRSLRTRTGNRDQITTSSTQKAATRKRSRTTEIEQAGDCRRPTQPRKFAEQSSPLHQFEGRKRRLNISESCATGVYHKWARHNLDKAAAENSAEQERADKVDGQDGPILYWIETGNWPNGYSEPHEKVMSHLFARQKSSGSLRRRQSALVSVEPASVTPSSIAPSSTTPSDQRPREVKSAPYQDARYEVLLATKGSFLEGSDLGIKNESKETYLKLLGKKQTVPHGSLFGDNVFEKTCRKIRNRNEAKIIQDITRLIVPSAEAFATCGAEHADVLIESVNEGWNNSLPVTDTRPQPDYAVGFRREAFSKQRLDKLAPYIGNFLKGDQGYFMATYYMYFPFLTCEVKCGAAALDIADRQNAHSMTLAVRAIVELFRLVGRETEIHQEILAFSISHDHRSVRIYGHYPIIDGKDTKYYRHPIHTFDFTALDGKEKWTAYKFTENVYDVWMPSHFDRLCSAIDKIPADLDFNVPQLSQSFGLSEDFEHHHLSGSSQHGSESQGHSQKSTSGARDTTPNTSYTGRGASKRPRKRHAEGE